MIVLLANSILILLFATIFYRSPKAACFICGLQAFLILAMRSEFYGADALYYYNGYHLISGYSFEGICSVLSSSPIKVASLPYPYAYENGWVIVNWLFSHIGFTYRQFIIVLSGLTSFSLSFFAYRYSKKPGYSIFIATCLIFYLYSFYVLRQTLAFCICLFASKYLLERKPGKFFILLLLAISFHRSAAIFAVLYPFVNRPVTKNTIEKSLVACVVLILVSAFFLPNILPRVLALFGKSHYALSFKFNNLLMLQLLTVGCLLFFDIDKLTKSKTTSIAIWSSILSMLLYSLFLSNEVMARAIEYVWVFVIALIPAILEELEKHQQLIAYMGISLLLVIYLAHQIQGTTFDPYLFASF